MGEYCTRVVRAPNETFVLSLSFSLSFSLPSAPLSSCSSAPLQPRSLFLHPLFASSRNPFFTRWTLSLPPLPPPFRRPFNLDVPVARLRDENELVVDTLQRRGNGHIFIPTRRPTNSRNVIAQLRGSFSSPDHLLSFRSCLPILPFRSVLFLSFPFLSFPTTRHHETSLPTIFRN